MVWILYRFSLFLMYFFLIPREVGWLKSPNFVASSLIVAETSAQVLGLSGTELSPGALRSCLSSLPSQLQANLLGWLIVVNGSGVLCLCLGRVDFDLGDTIIALRVGLTSLFLCFPFHFLAPSRRCLCFVKGKTQNALNLCTQNA